MGTLGGEPDFCRRPDSLRAAQNSHCAGRGHAGEACPWMELCTWTACHGTCAGGRLRAGADALGRADCIRTDSVSRMVLLRAEARTLSRADARLERTESGSRILRSLHLCVRPGKVALASCRLS